MNSAITFKHSFLQCGPVRGVKINGTEDSFEDVGWELVPLVGLPGVSPSLEDTFPKVVLEHLLGLIIVFADDLPQSLFDKACMDGQLEHAFNHVCHYIRDDRSVPS